MALPPHTHSRIRDAINCIAVVCCAVAIGVAIWWAIHLARARDTPFVIFSADTEAVANFSVVLEQDGAKQYQITGVLRGAPTAGRGRTAYVVMLDNAIIIDAAGRTVMAFSKSKRLGADGVTFHANNYHVDAAIAPENRAKIYRAFNIDTTATDITSDESIFLQHVDVVISKSGVIEQITLPSAIRNALHSGARGRRYSPLLWEALTHSDKLPSLIAKKQTRLWETKGQFFLPLSFLHRVDGTGPEIKIMTTSRGGTGPLPGHASAILYDNSWSLEWKVNPATRHLETVTADVVWEVGESLLKTISSTQYRIRATLTPERTYTDQNSKIGLIVEDFGF